MKTFGNIFAPKLVFLTLFTSANLIFRAELVSTKFKLHKSIFGFIMINRKVLLSVPAVRFCLHSCRSILKSFLVGTSKCSKIYCLVDIK